MSSDGITSAFLVRFWLGIVWLEHACSAPSAVIGILCISSSSSIMREHRWEGHDDDGLCVVFHTRHDGATKKEEEE